MLSFDTETALIKEARLAPPLACITFSDGTNADLIHHADPAAQRCAEWLLQQHVTTANGPYDLAVLWAAFPDLRDLIWDAVHNGRVHDVQTRQKLMDIGEGRYRRVYKKLLGDEKARLLGYSLTDLHARYFGVFMEKDEWRLKYGELRELPLEQWPEAAKRYALYDAVATSRIHTMQDKQAEQMDKHNLWDESFQVRSHWSLHLASCWGFRADPKQVEKVIGNIDNEMPALIKRLQSVNLVRMKREKGIEKYVRSEKLAKQFMYAAVGDKGELTDTGYKKVKSGAMSNDEALRAGYIKIDEEWCEISGYPALVDYYHFRQNQLLRTKLTNIRQAAFYGLPIQTSFEVLMETGRTSSRDNKIISNSMGLQNPPRKGGVRECFIPREGCTIIDADFGQAELVSLAQVTYSAFGFSKMRDLLNADRDIHVDFGSQVMAAQIGRGITYEEAWALHKSKGSLGDLSMGKMRTLAKCFTGDTEVLTKERGWVQLQFLTMEDTVAAATFGSGGQTNIVWEKPTRLTTRHAEELIHLKSNNIDIMVTPDHRMASWTLRGGALEHEVCTPLELGKKRAWPSAGMCLEGDWVAGAPLIELAVITHQYGKVLQNTGRIVLSVPENAAAKVRELLLEADVAFEAGSLGNILMIEEGSSVRILGLLGEGRSFPWWWLTTDVAFRFSVLAAVHTWCGRTKQAAWQYASQVRQNVDVIQAIAAITDLKTSTSSRASYSTHGDYRQLTVKKSPNSRGGSVETKRVPWNNTVYCITIPSDAVLVRANGKTLVTHQCANFGYPGGLGWKSFKSYAKKAWGVDLTDDKSKQLKIDWLRHFPEMREYFRWIGRLMEEGGGTAAIQQYMSQRWRGDCRYTQGCNTLFQGLTADAAKAAFYELSRLCYSVKSSDLYGCRPLLFVHDEALVEAPLDQAAEAAVEQERVMVEIYQSYTPDVKITAGAHLMSRWSKDAEALYDERGRLIPWSPPQEEDEKWEKELVAA